MFDKEPRVSIKARVGIPKFVAKEITVPDVPVSALEDAERLRHLVSNAFLKYIRDFVIIQDVTVPAPDPE